MRPGTPFHESEDLQLLRTSVAAYVARENPPARLRQVRELPEGFDRARLRRMAGFGWLGLALPEAHGGLGLGHDALAALHEELGHGLVPEPVAAMALSAGVLAHAEAGAAAGWLPRVLAGDALVPLAWQGAPGAIDATDCGCTATPDGAGWRLAGQAVFVPLAHAPDQLLAAARLAGGVAVFALPPDAAGLAIETRRAVDFATVGTLRLDAVAAPAGALVIGAGRGGAVLDALLDRARLAAAAEASGAMARALAMTLAHLRLREQFGRPIGAFQALQHRAVDLYTQLELARASVRAAAQALDAGAAEAPLRVAACKARCAEAGVQLGSRAIHLHGAIGITEEYDLGLAVRRIHHLAAWLGNGAAMRRRHARLAPALPVVPTPPVAPTGLPAAPPPAEPAAAPDYNALPESDFRRMVREHVLAHCPAELRHSPRHLDWHDVRPWTKALAARGWLAPGWPVEHGGMGLDVARQLAFQEELDLCGAPRTPIHGPASIGPLIIRFGTAAQQRFFLPRIVSGDLIWCQGYSEPGAGSDLAALRTHAVLDGDHWVVNGQKVWTSNAHLADWIFMLVRTDREARPQQGITMLLVDMRSPGIDARPIRTLSGGSETAQAFFDDVRVPVANVLGPVNQGWSVAKALLGFERIMLGSPRQAREALLALERVVREAGGIDDPVCQDALIRLAMDIDDLSALYAAYGSLLQQGRPLGAEVSVLKVWASETYQRVAEALPTWADEHGALLGPGRFADGEVDVLASYFVSRVASIYGGTNDIQRNIVARAVLGLPG